MCDTGLNIVAATAVNIFALCHASPAQTVSYACPRCYCMRSVQKKSSVSNHKYVVLSRLSSRHSYMIVFHIYEVVEWNVHICLDRLIYFVCNIL